MGLAVEGARLALATLSQVVPFADMGPATAAPGAEAVHIPKFAQFTGDLDVHDMAFHAEGRCAVVNTLFGGLAPADRRDPPGALGRGPAAGVRGRGGAGAAFPPR
jgi:hypothetical protein